MVEVVGVVKDSKNESLEEPATPMLYRPIALGPPPNPSFLVVAGCRSHRLTRGKHNGQRWSALAVQDYESRAPAADKGGWWRPVPFAYELSQDCSSFAVALLQERPAVSDNAVSGTNYAVTLKPVRN